MRTHSEVVPSDEETERAALAKLGGPVVGSPGCCPICGVPLTGRQTSACSDRCRAAKSRRQRAEGQAERNRRVRELLEAAVRLVSQLKK